MARQKQERKQKTPKGYEIPVPKRGEVERDLKKLAGSGKRRTHTS
jgi:hypothetical protein